MQRKPRRSFVLAAVTAVGVLVMSGVAQRVAQSAPDTATAEMLAQNFKAQHEIGKQYRINPAELPPPKAGPIVTNRVLIVPFNGQSLQVPPGFTATPFATGLVNPRRLLVLANGDVLVAEQSGGYLTLLRDDGEGRAKWHGNLCIGARRCAAMNMRANDRTADAGIDDLPRQLPCAEVGVDNRRSAARSFDRRCLGSAAERGLVYDRFRRLRGRHGRKHGARTDDPNHLPHWFLPFCDYLKPLLFQVY